MANNFVTDAINLKSYNLSEADKIIVMYSKDKGLIKGVAKGVKKTKSKLGARMDLLAANTVMLHKGKNLDTICQAEALNTFKKTRTDLDKIFYSMYVTEIVSNFGVEEDPSASAIYELLYKTLDSIANSQNKIEIMLSVIKFQLKIMIESGFTNLPSEVWHYDYGNRAWGYYNKQPAIYQGQLQLDKIPLILSFEEFLSLEENLNPDLIDKLKISSWDCNNNFQDDKEQEDNMEM